MNDYQVYIVKCTDGSFYTGIAKDPDARFEKHKSGTVAKYFRKTKPWVLIWRSEQMDKSSALKMEIKIKKLSHKQKTDFVFGRVYLDNIVKLHE